VSVRLEPWGPGDLGLLERLLGDEAMMEHLGGPETPEKIAARQARYEVDPGCLKIVLDGDAVGWVGFWDREWGGETVYETGWSVLPAAQGRGVARAAATLAVAAAAATGLRRYAHAFPSVENAASNALCAKVGFTLLGAVEFEYPPGSLMRCNDWRIVLRRPTSTAAGWGEVRGGRRTPRS
jgi:RimJ/RimL family protein N-acetyltransferase